jgi:hypothetical protein
MILNKLSLTNFDKLSDELMNVLSAQPFLNECMDKVVEMLVTKAQVKYTSCRCNSTIDVAVNFEPDGRAFLLHVCGLMSQDNRQVVRT